MIIAVDGKIASGKTYLAQFISNEYQYYYLNLDQEIKKLYLDDNISKQVTSLLAIKEIDHQIISDIIFNDNDKRQALETLLYPYLQKLIKQYQDKNLIIDGYNSFKIVDYDLGFLICSNYQNRYKRNQLRKTVINNFDKINKIQKDLVICNHYTYAINNNDYQQAKLQIKKIMEYYDKNWKNS